MCFLVSCSGVATWLLLELTICEAFHAFKTSEEGMCRKNAGALSWLLVGVGELRTKHRLHLECIKLDVWRR